MVKLNIGIVLTLTKGWVTHTLIAAKSEVRTSRAGTPSRQDSLAAQFAAIKDQTPRKWSRQKILFKNLEGGTVEICSWATGTLQILC